MHEKLIFKHEGHDNLTNFKLGILLVTNRKQLKKEVSLHNFPTTDISYSELIQPQNKGLANIHIPNKGHSQQNELPAQRESTSRNI